MNDKTRYQIMKNRQLLTGYNLSDVGAEKTDQEKNLSPLPPLKKKQGWGTIVLPTDFEKLNLITDIRTVFAQRESRRKYSPEPVSLLELSFFLWSAQGVRRMAGPGSNPVTFRNVPSAGSRHPLETYLFLNNVEGLDRGIYHYLPENHQLEVWDKRGDYEEELTEALCGQTFAAKAPVVFVLSALPYRTEWRYGLKSAKYILLDTGHACENLYLAATAVGCGCCAVGAYDQDRLDELLDFMPGPSAEKTYECAVYAAAVGKLPAK